MRNTKGAAHHIVRLFLMMGFFLAITSSSKAQDSFQIPSWLQEKLGLTSYQDFLLFENAQENSQYSVVSTFEGTVVESQPLIGTRDLDSAQKFIDEHLKIHQGGSIRELELPSVDGSLTSLFWVGHQSYTTLDQAKQVAEKASAEGIKLHSEEKTEAISETPVVPENVSSSTNETAPSSLKPKSAYPLHLDEKIQRVAIPGTELKNETDRFDYQTFGEFSWRRTNFDSPNTISNPDYFNDIVGFHSLRIIMKGLHFKEGWPTLNPFIEGTVSLSSNDTPFENKFVGAAGLEYYLLESVGFLKQTPWLDWLRNFRLFGQYMDLSHLRDTDSAAPTYDWRAGMGLYKAWGWDKPFDKEREGFSDYLWGELFMENVWKKTDFNSEDYESFTWTDVAWLGVKFPWIGNIPPLMPYAKVELTSTQREFFFQNRAFAGFGARYMPFHTTRFEKNEWLYNFKIFAEYDHMIDHFKDEPDGDQPDWDFRVGVKIDINRF